MKNKNGNNKTTKIITIEKKNSSIFAFFKKIQLFMSVERKTILDVVAIKHRKHFLKIVQKSLIFSKNIILALKFKCRFYFFGAKTQIFRFIDFYMKIQIFWNVDFLRENSNFYRKYYCGAKIKYL